MALDMRALYYVALPTERSEADDVQRHEEDIKAKYEDGILSLSIPKKDPKAVEAKKYIAIEGK